MMRMKDAYLEPWTRLQTRQKLSAAFKVAHRLGMINRALSWYEGSRTLSEENRALNADAVPGWLQDFLYAE